MDKVTTTMASITRVMAGSVFLPAAPGVLAVAAGTTFVVGGVTYHFADSTVVLLPDTLSPGRDYVIRLAEGALIAELATGDLDGVLGGLATFLDENGKPRPKDSYGWRDSQTMAQHLVGKEINAVISTAVRDTVVQGNLLLADTIEKAIKSRFDEVRSKLSIKVMESQ